MENFENTVNNFLEALKSYHGRAPQFSIDYSKEKLIITDSPSGFLKILYNNDRFMGHLKPEGISVQYFTPKR